MSSAVASTSSSPVLAPVADVPALQTTVDDRSRTNERESTEERPASRSVSRGRWGRFVNGPSQEEKDAELKAVLSGSRSRSRGPASGVAAASQKMASRESSLSRFIRGPSDEEKAADQKRVLSQPQRSMSPAAGVASASETMARREASLSRAAKAVFHSHDKMLNSLDSTVKA